MVSIHLGAAKHQWESEHWGLLPQATPLGPKLQCVHAHVMDGTESNGVFVANENAVWGP